LSSQYLDPRYMTAAGARSSHNSYLTVLVEQGVPGALLMLLLMGWMVRALIEVRRTSTRTGDLNVQVAVAAVGGSLAVIFVCGQFADFSKCEVQIWMIAMLAALQAGCGRHGVPTPVGTATSVLKKAESGKVSGGYV